MRTIRTRWRASSPRFRRSIRQPAESSSEGFRRCSLGGARRQQGRSRQAARGGSDPLGEFYSRIVEASHGKSRSNSPRPVEVKPPADLDGRFYAIHLLRNHIRDERLGDPTSLPYRDPLATFSNVISSFVIACKRSLREMSDPNRAEFKKGEAWNKWICDLAAILEPSGLTTSARKDFDKRKQERPSRFVVLVSALQEYVPAQCRRTCSEAGMATAISRAKRQLSGQ